MLNSSNSKTTTDGIYQDKLCCQKREAVRDNWIPLLKLPQEMTHQTKRTRNDTSGDSCVTCGKDVEEEGVECNWCFRWEHCSCASLSSEEYSVLSSSSCKIMFFCSLCYYRVPFALRIQDEQQKSEDRLKSVEDKLTEVVDKMTSSPTQQVSTNEDSLNSVANNIAASLAAEQKDKERRELNIIVHNIDESPATSGAERKSEDIAKVSEVIQKVLKVPCSITKAFRIGKKKDKPRLLKVSVHSLQEKINILRNKRKLKDQSNPEKVRKVYITPDLTPSEQAKNKALRQQLADMNKVSNIYMIKNGKIVRKGGG